MNKYTIILLSILLLLVIGCAKQPNSFDVKYYATYSSSSGIRILNITYRVDNNEISSCKGNYSYPPSQPQREAGIWKNNIEECDVERLNSKDYNVPLNFITDLSGKEMTGEVQDRAARYKWEVIIE